MFQIEQFEVTQITAANKNNKTVEVYTPIIATDETTDTIVDSYFDSRVQVHHKQDHRMALVQQYASSKMFISTLISRLDLLPPSHSNPPSSEFALV